MAVRKYRIQRLYAGITVQDVEGVGGGGLLNEGDSASMQPMIQNTEHVMISDDE